MNFQQQGLGLQSTPYLQNMQARQQELQKQEEEMLLDLENRLFLLGSIEGLWINPFII